MVVVLSTLVAIVVAAYTLGGSNANVNLDWGGLVLAIVAIGGLVLAGYQARLNAQERVATQRQVLYEQQILSCIEVMSALIKVKDIVLLAVWSSFPYQPTPWIWTKPASQAAQRACIEGQKAYAAVLNARVGILPDPVATLLTQIDDDLRDVFAVDDRCAQAKMDVISLGVGRATEVIRFSLGVEPLSRQTLARIGADEITRSMVERAARHEQTHPSRGSASHPQ